MNIHTQPRCATSWSLQALLAAAEITTDATTNPGVSDLQFDSRRVGPGSVYLALPGLKTQGARFAATAIAQGAVAVVTDAAGAELVRQAGIAEGSVPIIVVDDPRAAMARLAVAINHDPSDRVPMFAVTGTNGKTTTMFLLEAALTALGQRVGTLGTIGFRLDGAPLEWTTSTVTTPESPDLQRLFAEMVERGADTIAMEVSSHALALQRVAGTHFLVAGFTMLGRDHLDFHADMEDYFATKARLFTTELSEHAVVNVDGEWGRRLAGMITDKPLTTVGRSPGVNVRVVCSTRTEDGLGHHVRLEVAGETVDFQLPIPGEHNVDNAALALAMVHAAGLDVSTAARGLAGASVPGRMQRLELGEGAPMVVVDFAHTPQAVEEALDAVRVPGRVLTVMGAGGDRDRAKRPLMGEAAGRGAQVVVVTDDNPRTEDPAAIREAVAAGVRRTEAELYVVGDRREAIAFALSLAGPQDAVMVLGKGHERGQLVGDKVLDFDDRQVCLQAWQELSRRN